MEERAELERRQGIVAVENPVVCRLTASVEALFLTVRAQKISPDRRESFAECDCTRNAAQGGMDFRSPAPPKSWLDSDRDQYPGQSVKSVVSGENGVLR